MFEPTGPRSRLAAAVAELRTWRWQWLLLLPAVLFWLVVIDIAHLAAIWPDWDDISRGAVPQSRFIAEYERRAARDRDLPRLRWRPVPIADLPEHIRRAFILAEDARFYSHDGVDFEAVGDAIGYNIEKGRVVVGASTISQQTVKNLFLTRRRSLLRKWHELLLTWRMEHNLSKHRILAIYLNTVELGPGIYGVEAAAQAYWGKSASRLTVAQAAALAATLPSPIKHNPATQTEAFQRRRQKVTRFLREAGWRIVMDDSESDQPTANATGTASAEVGEPGGEASEPTSTAPVVATGSSPGSPSGATEPAAQADDRQDRADLEAEDDTAGQGAAGSTGDETAGAGAVPGPSGAALSP
jgi:monofunctional biosynthetic peptidoglycan transglycosylase